MDRIYYFMIAKEKAGEPEFPIFRKEVGPYEVYYLQVPKDAENGKLASLRAYMEKGIRRISAQCDPSGAFSVSEEAVGITRMVWDRELEKRLQTDSRLARWLKDWDLPLYQEYREVHNLQLLLQHIPTGSHLPRLVILGEAAGLTDWLESLARNRKRITVYARNQPREFESLRQTLLQEYGLLIRWEQSLQPAAEEPALVLDYSGKEKIYTWGIRPGSIWIDMESLEMRRHALEDRETGVQYLSLKNIWQKEIQQTLDTMRKIQYNVGVKLTGK